MTQPAASARSEISLVAYCQYIRSLAGASGILTSRCRRTFRQGPGRSRAAQRTEDSGQIPNVDGPSISMWTGAVWTEKNTSPTYFTHLVKLWTRCSTNCPSKTISPCASSVPSSKRLSIFSSFGEPTSLRQGQNAQSWPSTPKLAAHVKEIAWFELVEDESGFIETANDVNAIFLTTSHILSRKTRNISCFEMF